MADQHAADPRVRAGTLEPPLRILRDVYGFTT